MSRPFDVTAAAGSVRLDAQGRGVTTFTVSNVSGRARRGRARIVPGDPAQTSWLSIEGEAERDFPADKGTQQFVVKIAAPPGAAPGRFSFELDVVSVENPDEDFTEGPKVGFEVAPPPPKKPFPWWILAVIAAILLVGAVVFWLLHRNPPKVALEGSCQQDAECADGLFCAKEVGAQAGVCLGKVGFAGCRRAQDCGAHLTCQTGTCTGTVGFASCQKPADCATGLLCTGGKCLGAAGFSGCATPADCATNLCVNGTCVDRTTLRRCSTDAQCAPEEACAAVTHDKLCLRRTGSTCNLDLECLTRTCTGGTCQASTGPCLGNGDCAAPYTCVSQTCLIPNGQPCSGNLQCASGNCRDGTCQQKPCLSNADCGRFFFCAAGQCKLMFQVKEQVLQERVILQPYLKRIPPPGQ